MKTPSFSIKKSSTASGKLWLYGKHAVIAALKNPRRTIHELWVTANINEEYDHFTWYKGKARLSVVEPKKLSSLLGESAVHQGIAAACAPLPEISLEEALRNRPEAKSTCVLFLDQVTDPHNVGAILRSAAAFAVAAVIVPRHHSPQESGTLAKTASGSLELVPLITVTNFSQTFKELKKQGFWCIGLDGYAETSVGNTPAYDKIALILGAEGKGLRQLTRTQCDLLVKLPIREEVESLNVSNAAAIALYALMT